MHPAKELGCQAQSRRRTENGVYTTMRAQRRRADPIVLIDPFLDLARREDAATIEAAAVVAPQDFLAVIATVRVRDAKLGIFHSN